MKAAENIYFILFSLAFLSANLQCALIYIPGVPITRETLQRTQIALNRWQNLLKNTYKTKEQNPAKIKRATDLVVGQLNVLSNELAGYNNFLLGGGNAVLGNKNIIIGGKSTVYGSNNYIFSQDFDYKKVNGGNPLKPISNNLVSNNWVGELDKRELILKHLHNVIYPIN